MFQGTIFKIDANGNESIIHSFSGGVNDGAYPSGNLVADSVGNLYGTAIGGGVAGNGVVFKLDPVTGKLTVLYSFTGLGGDGFPPGYGVVRDSDGNLYGTTVGGGIQADCANGCGTVFKLDPAGNETVLYSFRDELDGYDPVGLVMDTTGNLFGATTLGKQSKGAVYKIDSAGDFSVLTPSVGTTRGKLILGKHGLLYGTTMAGGASGLGSVYAIIPDGTETVLFSFTGGSGYAPYAGVLQGKAGNLYGTTYYGSSNCSGEVFKLDNTTHAFSIVHCFNSQTDGANPEGGLVQDSAGNIYGTALQGGSTGKGTVFKIIP